MYWSVFSSATYLPFVERWIFYIPSNFAQCQIMWLKMCVHQCHSSRLRSLNLINWHKQARTKQSAILCGFWVLPIGIYHSCDHKQVIEVESFCDPGRSIASQSNEEDIKSKKSRSYCNKSRSSVRCYFRSSHACRSSRHCERIRFVHRDKETLKGRNDTMPMRLL
jgi:hypothetical protein